MDRFGIFVDAGYLFAAAGLLCCGTRDRSRLSLDHEKCLHALERWGAGDCRLSHLRTYWYDGAKDGQPTAQHLSVGSLPGVKIRLGRLTQSGQKGVDSRIVRDLIILAQERAISVAYLLGGDEDLREGVSEAQERGVRVVLLDIESTNGRSGIAQTLRMEADEILYLKKDFWGSMITLVPPQPAVPVATPAPPSSPPAPRDVGREFGVSWIARVSPEEASGEKAGRPKIPPAVDQQLLSWAGQRFGTKHVEDDDRKAVRAGFWDAVTAGRQDLSPPT